MVDNKGICIITFSDNYDHQEVAFSMFNALYPQYNVYNIGLTHQKNPRSPVTDHSFYYDAPRRPGITKGSFNFKLVNRIVRKINSLDINCVYFESEHLWNAFIMRKLRKDIKRVVVIHDVIPHSDSKGKALANKVCCKMADFVVIRNDKYKEELIKRYNVKEEKVLILPYYPDFEENTQVEGFLFFGRIRKYKGIDSMLKIAEQLPNIHFTIAGSSDEECRPIVEKIKRLENCNVIDREVSDNEMEMLFKQSKSIILPYSSATQSGVIIDAYKYGRPVIAFNVGAICEQVLNGKSGFLVDDEVEFINKIKKIENMEPMQLCAQQKNAYGYGYDKYSTQKNMDLFVKTFIDSEEV